MERRKYIAELVARTGLQVDENDPVFAVVLLNRLILEDQKSELETLVEQLSKTGKAINGEVVKQAQDLWDSKTRQLNAEAARLRTDLEREHANHREVTREALREIVGNTIASAASTIQNAQRSIMGPVWMAAIGSGIASGIVVALATSVI